MSRLERLKSLIAFRRASLDAAERGLEDASDRLEAARKLQAAWQEAQGVLQQAAEAVQNVVHSKIAGTVTRCLQAVYDDSLSFHVEFDRKRGKTEARLFFTLRLAVLKLHTPAVAQVLIADESFRFLDRQAKPRMAELLMQVSEQMQIQIVLVTHDSDFEVGKVVRL
jgi:hypothetical protein